MKKISRDDYYDGDDDDTERHCISLLCWVRILDDCNGWAVVW
jgi:hypothetical protein